MTGRQAALRAFAFASTAKVADSAIAAIRAEILLMGEVCTIDGWGCALRLSGPRHPVLLREPPALTLRRSRTDFGSPWRARKFSRRAVAQLARVAVSKAAGWGFESLLPCKTHYRMNDEREGTQND